MINIGGMQVSNRFENCDVLRSNIPAYPEADLFVHTLFLGMYTTRKVGLSVLRSSFNGIYHSAMCTKRVMDRVVKPVYSIAVTANGYFKDELKGLFWHLRHPAASFLGTLYFLIKDPYRQIRLLQVCGVPVDPCTMGIFELRSDLTMCNDLAPIIVKHGADPACAADKNMDKLRGKVLITIIRSVFDGGEDLSRKLSVLLSQLAGNTLQRAGCKTYRVATGHK